jgi:hypothetical protein
MAALLVVFPPRKREGFEEESTTSVELIVAWGWALP